MIFIPKHMISTQNQKLKNWKNASHFNDTLTMNIERAMTHRSDGYCSWCRLEHE